MASSLPARPEDESELSLPGHEHPTDESAQATPPSGPFKKALFRGSLWAVSGYAAGQVIRLGGNLVLWRLLSPEVFGLMAIVSAVMQGLSMFSDVGIGPSIIQSERGDDPRYLNTAWTIQVLRGFALAVVAAALAIPVAHFYDAPELAQLVPVVALQSVISGFNSTNLFTVARNISLGRLTAIDVGCQLLSLGVTLVVAAVHHSVWALVAGGTASALARVVAGHVLLPGVANRLTWDRSSAASLFHFGRWVFFSTLLTFAVMQSDRLIFGKLIPLQRLGVYSIATVWALLPMSVIGHVFDSVVFPALSRLQGDTQRFAQALRSTRTPWLILAGWLCSCLCGGGPLLVRVLYDERAKDAGWIVQVLSAGVWLLTLENANGTALLARGLPKFVAAGNFAKLLGMVVLIPLGMFLYGFPGAVVGFAGSELFRYLASVIAMIRIDLFDARDDLLLTGLVAASSLLGWLVSSAVASALSTFSVEHARAAALICGACVLVVLSAIWGFLFASRVRAKRQLA